MRALIAFRLTRPLAIAAQCAAMALLASQAQAATTTTATVSSGTTFNVASNPLGGVAGCGIASGSHSYGTTSFLPTQTDTYSFEAITAGTTISDPFLAIYQGAFDPANPTNNLVGCDDDSGVGLLPAFSTTLTAGTTYVMVATTYGVSPQNGTVTFTTGIVPTLSLADLSTTVGAAGQSMVATSNATGAITYSINNPGIATIDPNTGALTLLSVGTATVTATQASEASPGLFNGGTITAQLTVAVAPPIPATPASIPTLGEWAQIILTLLLLGMAGWSLRRR